MKKIELLAPAKNLEFGITAINYGADALYIGSPKFGARAAAGNSIENIKALTNYAHRYYAKVYVTINTILFDNELEEVQKTIYQLYDIGVDAVKIGMLFSPELIKTIAGTLDEFQVKNIVLDPVMVATSGDKLLQDDAIAAIMEHLIPMADILTPNLPEASVLVAGELNSRESLEKAAEDLASSGCKNILIKGGHLTGQSSDDLLYMAAEKQFIELTGERISTGNTHGTGCTLSSAIASFIARDYETEAAIVQAKSYIQGAIEAGADYRIGKGHGPVHHFYQNWS